MDNEQLTIKEVNKENPVLKKTFEMALQSIKVSKLLQKNEGEYIISKQLMRSGTSVGAMVREAQHAESKADFIHKMSIALKEANETEYWIELLEASEMLDKTEINTLNLSLKECVRMLTSIVKTAKQNNRK